MPTRCSSPGRSIAAAAAALESLRSGLRSLGAPLNQPVTADRFLFLSETGALAILIILGIRTAMGEAAFLDWGWRYPFFVAFAINVVALFARLVLAFVQSAAAEGAGCLGVGRPSRPDSHDRRYQHLPLLSGTRLHHRRARLRSTGL